MAEISDVENSQSASKVQITTFLIFSLQMIYCPAAHSISIIFWKVWNTFFPYFFNNAENNFVIYVTKIQQKLVGKFNI